MSMTSCGVWDGKKLENVYAIWCILAILSACKIRINFGSFLFKKLQFFLKPNQEVEKEPKNRHHIIKVN